MKASSKIFVNKLYLKDGFEFKIIELKTTKK